MANIDVDALLDRHRARFKRLVQEIVAEEEGPDPFSFSLARYRELSDAERASLVRRAGRLARDRVDRELRGRGAAWIVLVGDRIAMTSDDATRCPSIDEVLALGEAEDLVAYLFEAPLIEEISCVSRWAQLGQNDAYPTLPVAVDHAGDTRVLEADLDTGSHATLLDAAFSESELASWFEGRHLGEAFLWAPALAQLTLKPSSGGVLQRRVPVRFVRDWLQSPFVRISRGRRALIGRDLLRAFALTVTLSAPDSATTIVSSR